MENGTNIFENDQEFQEKLETIQKVLQEYYRDYHLQVNFINCGPGSKTGDNYMSIIKRISVKGTRKNHTGEFFGKPL